jgi:hypothetical protein
MTAKIIDGKQVAAAIRAELKDEVQQLKARCPWPMLPGRVWAGGQATPGILKVAPSRGLIGSVKPLLRAPPFVFCRCMLPWR